MQTAASFLSIPDPQSPIHRNTTLLRLRRDHTRLCVLRRSFTESYETNRPRK